MSITYHLIIVAVVSYFLGNISPSILIGRIHGIDIRKEGSGNAGTTNVLRVLGVKAAAATLLIDVLKGYVAVRIGLNYGDLGAMIAFVCVVYGHIFPVLYKFKGGKGVATSLGAALALDWLSAFALILIAILITALSRKMSLGSIIAAISYPFLIWYYYPSVLPMAIVLAITVVVMHRSNIVRLVKREEPSLSFGSKSKEKTVSSEKKPADSEAEIVPQEESIENGVKEQNLDTNPNPTENAESVDMNEPVKEDSPAEEPAEGILVAEYLNAVSEKEEEEAKDEQSTGPVDYFQDVLIPKVPDNKKKRIAVVDESPFGLALANRLLYQGHNVIYYVSNKDTLKEMTEKRNSKMLPDLLLSKRLRYTGKLKTALHNREWIIVNPENGKAWNSCKNILKNQEKTTLILVGEPDMEIPKGLKKHSIIFMERPDSIAPLTHNEEVRLNASSDDLGAAKKTEETLQDEHFEIVFREEE